MQLTGAGCESFTTLMCCHSALVPAYAVSYKNGMADGRHACFGRVTPGDIQPTVSSAALAAMHSHGSMHMTSALVWSEPEQVSATAASASHGTIMLPCPLDLHAMLPMPWQAAALSR